MSAEFEATVLSDGVFAELSLDGYKLCDPWRFRFEDLSKVGWARSVESACCVRRGLVVRINMKNAAAAA